MKKTVLLVGPLPDPVTGQSVAFELISDSLASNAQILVLNVARTKYKLVNGIYTLILSSVYVMFFSVSKVYLSGSRSHSGFLKELVLYIGSYIRGYDIIYHLHGSDFNDFYGSGNFLQRAIKSISFQNVKFIILHEKMADLIPDKSSYSVVQNFYHKDFEVDVDVFSKKNRIVYYSNLMKSKGILTFLDAVEEVLAIHNDWSVAVAGTFIGDEECDVSTIRELCESKMSNLRVRFGSRFTFLGKCMGQDRVELLRSSKVFVLPTRYRTEAVPLSIIEAMRAGNVIVSTNHNLIPFVVTSRSGYLIDPFDTEALTSILSRLVDEKLESMAELNISIAKEIYSPDIHVRKVKSILS